MSEKESLLDDVDRRQLLRGVAASSAVGAGAVGATGSAVAQNEHVSQEERERVTEKYADPNAIATEFRNDPVLAELADEGVISDASPAALEIGTPVFGTQGSATGKTGRGERVTARSVDGTATAEITVFRDVEEGKLTLIRRPELSETAAIVNPAGEEEPTTYGYPDCADCGDDCCELVCCECGCPSCGTCSCYMCPECTCGGGWL